MTEEVKNYLQEHFDLPAEQCTTPADAEQLLAEKVNDLIQTNFEKLVNLLYRIDVNEQKLRQLLKEHPEEDAGHIIAHLIIERQLQKIRNMQLFAATASDVPEEEKW